MSERAYYFFRDHAKTSAKTNINTATNINAGGLAGGLLDGSADGLVDRFPFWSKGYEPFEPEATKNYFSGFPGAANFIGKDLVVMRINPDGEKTYEWRAYNEVDLIRVSKEEYMEARKLYE